MAKSIMIQGTASNVGKSLITAGLCRLFTQDGYKTAPFKAQNMALNSFVTSDGLELGRAQAVQAEAAMKEPDWRMNPVLLKPTGDMGSQVIVNGEVRGNMTASEYFKYRKELIPEIREAYESLASENDIIVIEGAGSPAEINLKKDDIANMGAAEIAGAPVLLAGDIDRGGVFASLYGTVTLLDEKERARIKGVIINKFRGDKKILEPGLKMLEDLIHIPVIGTVPYADVYIDDEDSLCYRLYGGKGGAVDVVVIKLPHISNFTDFNAFSLIDGIGVRYVSDVKRLGEPDFIIIPGSKNTVGDLEWLRAGGFDGAIKKHAASGKPLMGICGGFQMLAGRISDPTGAESGGEACGLGFFDAATVFAVGKTRRRVSGVVEGVTGIFKGFNGSPFEGYEIHMGVTETEAYPIVCTGNVYGTYVHGIFDRAEILKAVAEALFAAKGLPFAAEAPDWRAYKNAQYDKLASLLKENLCTDLLYKIIKEGL